MSRGLALAAGLTLLALAAEAAAPRSWAWLGVRIRDLAEQEMDTISARHGMREGFGVMVVEVLDDTPARQAGVRPGDVVVAVEGRPVTDTRLLQRLIARSPLDRLTRVTVLRSDGRHDLEIRLSRMPPPVLGERVAAEFGFALRQPGRPPSGGAPPVPAAVVGVVLEGSPAAEGGLAVGDEVVRIEGGAVETAEAAHLALSGVSVERALRLTVRRGGRELRLTLPAP